MDVRQHRGQCAFRRASACRTGLDRNGLAPGSCSLESGCGKFGCALRRTGLDIEIMNADSTITALEAAEALCAKRGERLTPVRRRVLELVLTAPGPVKAYDLLEALKPGSGTAKPPTVYRALDFLIGLGLVHKVEALNAAARSKSVMAPPSAPTRRKASGLNAR